MLLTQPASSHASCEFCVVSASERAMFELEHGDGVGTHFAHIAVKGYPLVEAVLREPACLVRLLGIRYDEESSLLRGLSIPGRYRGICGASPDVPFCWA